MTHEAKKLSALAGRKSALNATGDVKAGFEREAGGGEFWPTGFAGFLDVWAGRTFDLGGGGGFLSFFVFRHQPRADDSEKEDGEDDFVRCAHGAVFQAWVLRQFLNLQFLNFQIHLLPKCLFLAS